MFKFKIEFHNSNMYCDMNPSKSYHNNNPPHFYINNNCKYCKCSKIYTIDISKYIANACCCTNIDFDDDRQ